MKMGAVGKSRIECGHINMYLRALGAKDKGTIRLLRSNVICQKKPRCTLCISFFVLESECCMQGTGAGKSRKSDNMIH